MAKRKISSSEFFGMFWEREKRWDEDGIGIQFELVSLQVIFVLLDSNGKEGTDVIRFRLKFIAFDFNWKNQAAKDRLKLDFNKTLICEPDQNDSQSVHLPCESRSKSVNPHCSVCLCSLHSSPGQNRWTYKTHDIITGKMNGMIISQESTWFLSVCGNREPNERERDYWVWDDWPMSGIAW